MSNQYWRSPESVRRLNGFGCPGFVAEFLCRSAAYRRDYARTGRQFARDSAHANAARVRKRENSRRDIQSHLFILPAVRCWSAASQRNLSLSNRSGDYFLTKVFDGPFHKQVRLQVGLRAEPAGRGREADGRPDEIRPLLPLADHRLESDEGLFVEPDHDPARESFRPSQSATVSEGRCIPRHVAVAAKHMMTRLLGRRRALLLAAGATCAACGAPGTVGAAPLSAAEFETLAARCAPSVPTATLEAVAKTDSIRGCCTTTLQTAPRYRPVCQWHWPAPNDGSLAVTRWI